MAPNTSEFERLIREQARVMAAAIRRVCGRRHGALVPDVQQEVYLALWKRLQGGNAIRHPTSYLYKVALATSLAVIRRYRPRHEELNGEPADPLPPPPVPGHLLPAERARLVEEVIEKLEPDPARAIRGYLAGLSHEELADLYGWSPSVARHLVYRSLQRLRERLGQGDHDD